MSQAVDTLLDLYRVALAAVEPAAAVRDHLRRVGRSIVIGGLEIPVRHRLLVAGVGKAAVPMALGVEGVCGDLIVEGIVITKDGHASGEAPTRIAVREAAHPIPDQRGVEATRQVLDLVRSAGPNDVVLAIISGGGSALLEAPRPPLTLDDMARTTGLLLRAGAPIEDLNAVRIPLSLVKGGGLRRAAGDAAVATLILSDVLGNDPRVIASGPTVPGKATSEDALDVLSRYGIVNQVPETIRRSLSEAFQDDLEAIDATQDALVIIADNATAVEAARQRAVERGLSASVVWAGRTGEARVLGREWVTACREAPPDVDVLLGGGEATVTVRGDGTGGRNTEFVLAAALELEATNTRDWVVASLATDGEDGTADGAGAYATAETCEMARLRGVDPDKALADNDSARLFSLVGTMVKPGPTGTNVNDLYLSVRR